MATHRAHETARRQMSAFDGMLSFQVRGGETEAMVVAARVNLFTRATSLSALNLARIDEMRMLAIDVWLGIK